MNLFASGDFTLHSGARTFWKIDCDALTDADWATLARIVAEKYTFGEVYGVPRGGLKFAAALQQYISSGSQTVLIVDDVLTTGRSMSHAMWRFYGRNVLGVVVFARKAAPLWIEPLFRMGI